MKGGNENFQERDEEKGGERSRNVEKTILADKLLKQ